jgi:dTDP-4-dehydrorhamnose 3,5-epimerase
MKFHPTPLPGSFLIEPEARKDARGMFSRVFCRREFLDHGLEAEFVQSNISRSTKKGTLRGMHYQSDPAAEVKLVRCVAGALFDVIVDLRPNSPTYLSWFGQQLTQENMLQMYVPRGFAHGFLTLADNTEIQYLVSEFYAPELEGGVRYNDPKIGIVWPGEPSEISEKDASWPGLT